MNQSYTLLAVAVGLSLSITGCAKYNDMRTSAGIHGCAFGYCIEPEVQIPVTPPVVAPAPVAVTTYLAPAPKVYDPLPDVPDTIKTLEK